MSALSIVLAIVFLLVCVGLNAIILMQKDRAGGFSANFSGGGETYYSKNKGRSTEGALERYTKIGGVVFGVLALLLLVAF